MFHDLLLIQLLRENKGTVISSILQVMFSIILRMLVSGLEIMKIFQNYLNSLKCGT